MINLVEKYEIVSEDTGNQVPLSDLIRLWTKQEAQAFAKSKGWRQYDVHHFETKFDTFWMVYDSHHNRILCKGDRVAKLEKKIHPLISGEQFLQIRQSSGCDRIELANIFNISPYQLSRWERGKPHELTPQQINSLVGYFE